MTEPRSSKPPGIVAVVGGLGGVALFAYGRRLEGREQGLFMAAAIGLVLLFVIIAAVVAMRRDGTGT